VGQVSRFQSDPSKSRLGEDEGDDLQADAERDQHRPNIGRLHADAFPADMAALERLRKVRCCIS
jgi:hypothetical protein